jgi:gas vesicle protein
MTNRLHGLKTVGLSVATGCFIGGMAGLLYAPQSGSRTRRRLWNFADKMREKIGEMTTDSSVAIEKIVQRSRRLMNA